ncbi:MAG: thioredoxin family protein [Halobacteriota archaeon]
MFFYRPTCPKCQATESIINQLGANYTGKATVQRINDDDAVNADIISQHRVSIVPTVILLNNGVEVQRWVYPINYAAVAGQIDSQLSAG